jgi:hypothetical protein
MYKIYVAYHSDFDFISKPGYVPIHVGSKISSKLLPILRDDSKEDNISELNSDYCELTATYWAWKNCKSEYVGLNHYRRLFSSERYKSPQIIKTTLKYFVAKLLGKTSYDRSNFIDITIEDGMILSEKSLLKLITKDKLVIPARFYLGRTVKDHFKLDGNYVEILESIILEKCTDEFQHSFKKSLSRNYLFPCNILLTNRKEFNEYCELIFPILDEHRFHYTKEKKEYNRIAGYMGELLTNAFIQYKISQGRRVAEYKLVYIS